jgi:hypothetical protein
MRSTYAILAVALAIGMTASCAHAPRLPTESSESLQRRTQYLQDHPNGLHNSAIMRGEVEKGMDIAEVIAVWGVPDRRIAKKSAREERWTYTARDEHSGDYISYELVFAERVLQRWFIDRGTSGTGGRWDEEAPIIDIPREPGTNAFGGSGAPPRK